LVVEGRGEQNTKKRKNYCLLKKRERGRRRAVYFRVKGVKENATVRVGGQIIVDKSVGSGSETGAARIEEEGLQCLQSGEPLQERRAKKKLKKLGIKKREPNSPHP